MKNGTKRKARGAAWTKEADDRKKELTRLKKMKDQEIDLSDIAEITDWRNGVVGKFYRPIKQSVTIRLDGDVLAWLRSGGKRYQTRINTLLRDAMENERRA